MAWVELQVIGVPSGRVELLTARLFTLGASGTQEDYLPGQAPEPLQPWDKPRPTPTPEHIILRAWFEDPDPQRIERDLLSIAPIEPAVIRWVVVPETDWEEHWKQGFEPIAIGSEIVIAPPWNAPDDAIIIDPGQAFGTGKHPSTLACLHAVEQLAHECESLLDVGCGSGIVALLGAKLGLDSEGIDIDADSVRESTRNAKLNDLAARFSERPIADIQHPRHLVACNLYAEAILELSPHLVRLTQKWLVLAGVLADRESLLRKRFEPTPTLVNRILDGEWVCLWYKR